MKQVLAIVGATGSGKSALADALAVRLDGEVVSADSMQVYRGMDIGTAKMPLAERSVPYHCLDVVAPGAEFNAALYQVAARTAIDDILTRGKLPVVCGGTGLYVRAALDCFELGDGEKDDATTNLAAVQLRQKLESEAELLGAKAFHAKLAAVDPASAALIHPNNVRRVVRAFEFLETGGSYAQQYAGFENYDEYYPTKYIAIDVERDELYRRINDRVDSMLASGLLEEVRGLVSAGFSDALSARQAIGYKELLPVLAGETSLEVAAAQIKQATRHYAKRQLTWFKRDKRIDWIKEADLPSQNSGQILTRVAG
ncbi:tRNA dimethylallyltransferase [Actinomycetota bacterium]|nr:tRNA dimethylallyltransferase [Actinomycetota bacterium]